MANSLIIYFSRDGENYVDGSIENLEKGNTEICAEYIQKATKGDLFEIETVNVYSDDYHTCTKEALNELNNGIYPKLIKYLDNIDDYENVFICGPCWWGTLPMPMFSLLERLDFTNKKVMLLITHEGSGLGNSSIDLIKRCKGVILKDTIAIRGSNCKNAENNIKNWVIKNITE